MLPVVVAPSSSDNNAICHVLAALWMTSKYTIYKSHLTAYETKPNDSRTATRDGQLAKSKNCKCWGKVAD